ncbi:MAG: 3-hydroxyacyl-CoA dehydrogenase family protein, partial [Acidobacteriota bacterium]|nr:3-hydroxyacyl-CoA dehydrogenase family protein [Acidobacteriota bacterium]
LVVGAGVMGRGIAALCALRGHDTRVFDADPEAQRHVRGSVESSWARGVERGKIAAEEADGARKRLRVVERLRDTRDVDFAIEAVPEALDLKRLVLGELDDLCPQGTVLASNTSSLSISRIARATGRRDRVIGIHFFNPVAVMPLVEVVCGEDTSEETERRALELVASLGKEAVRVKDSPGFATSRLGLALGLEAMRMVEEGVARPEDIDRAMELGYGHRMGPLKTSDLVGLDVRLAIADTLSSELHGGRFEPPAILRTMVAEGRTGKKSGEGFYRWEGDKPLPAAEKGTPAPARKGRSA